MSYPTITFNTISEWETYVNTNVITNGMELITGVIGNNAYNGAVKFVKQSPLNWAKMALYSSGGDVVLSNNFLGTALFLTTTPDSLSWGDNFYNEYVLINMTSNEIPLADSLVYYDLTGTAQDSIPANTCIDIFKAANDLWVQGNITGTSSGSAQKQPKTYIVGSTSGAPTVDTNTWTLAAFKNSWVTLVIARSIFVDMIDAGDGSPYITKSLSGDTLTITNYTWNTGDVLSFTLITP